MKHRTSEKSITETDQINICSACEALFAPGNVQTSESKTLSYNPKLQHHTNGRALKHAALEGCPLCLRVWSSLSDIQRKVLCGEDSAGSTDKASVVKTLHCSQDLPPVIGQVQRFVRDGCYKFDFHCGSVKWHFVTSPSSKADDLGDGRPPPWSEVSTSAEAVLAQAERWLINCLDRHDCGKQNELRDAQGQWQPTRLVDVGSSEKPILRLVLSENTPSSSIYMTLSHCWGATPIFTLRNCNLDLLYSSIPWDSLTQTFREAISVTRRLGIRYLWIDSLCIVQDSHADWLREGTLMGKIYKHSYCTIAATGVPNGQHGFFAARDPNVIRPLRVRFAEEVQREKTVSRKLNRLQRAQFKWTFAEWHDIVDVDLWTKNIDQAPLNQRAWVAQEVHAALCRI